MGAPIVAFLVNPFTNEWLRFVNSENDGWGSRALYLYHVSPNRRF